MLDKVINRVVIILANRWVSLVKSTNMSKYKGIMRCSADFVNFRQKIDITTFLYIINAFATRKLVAYTTDNEKVDNAC